MAKKYVKLHLGESKKALVKGIGNLRAALEENPHFAVKTKAKYKLAIAHMTVVHKMLSRVKCDPPDMSFECPPPPPAAVSARARTRTKRRQR
jgi:hypothetical protein